MSPLLRFARDHEPFLQNCEIHTTRGCYGAFRRAGIFLSHRRLHGTIPGYRGAIVDLVSRVVARGAGAVDVVIYLIDPRDPSSVFPEANALKRECVVYRKSFLSTSRGAREWAALALTIKPEYCVHARDLTKGVRSRSLGSETIALIAHDGRKEELLEFARKHFRFLCTFKSRVATGTTGVLLNGRRPDRMQAREWTTLKPKCDALRACIKEAKSRGRRSAGRFIAPKESGPKGGDAQIAKMILDGKCRRVVFFENPEKPHEHTEDIQLLERTGRECGKHVICIHDPKTAELFFNRWERLRDKPRSEKVLLATAFQRHFGVKAVLVPTRNSLRATWAAIVEAAGWYLLSAVASRAAETGKGDGPMRITVSWGVALRDIVDGLEARRQRLLRRDRGLASDEILRHGKVCVAPLQGIRAVEHERYEANQIGMALARFFRGRSLTLSSVWVTGREKRGVRGEAHAELERHWDLTDLVLTTCAPVRAGFGLVRAPEFGGFMRQMKRQAVGNIGGIYLRRETGAEVHARDFLRLGMSAEQFKRVKERGETVLVAGAQSNRLEIAHTALRTGWFSVFIGDLEFGRKLLRRRR